MVPPLLRVCWPLSVRVANLENVDPGALTVVGIVVAVTVSVWALWNLTLLSITCQHISPESPGVLPCQPSNPLPPGTPHSHPTLTGFARDCPPLVQTQANTLLFGTPVVPEWPTLLLPSGMCPSLYLQGATVLSLFNTHRRVISCEDVP